MDESRSTGREARSVSTGRSQVESAAEQREGPPQETPRDPVTGTPAHGGSGRAQRSGSRPEASSEEIKQDIRRTRAEMSETIDEIEYRMSPEHVKHEVRGAVRETVDEVKERFHPQRMAQEAGQSMLDTVKDNPVPALIAGLSIGYLFMKSGAETARRSSRSYRERQYRRGAEDERGYYYGPEGYYRRPVGAYSREEASGREQEWGAGARETGRSATERASEMAGEARERASERAQEVSDRASEWAGEAQQQARQAGRRVQRRARQAQGRVERFVHRNPVGAGAVAIGAGAFLGSMLPSTRTEDKWMGEARDEVMHRASEVTEETMHRAQEAAGRVGEEAKHAAQDVAETAKEETKRQAEEGSQSSET